MSARISKPLLVIPADGAVRRSAGTQIVTDGTTGSRISAEALSGMTSFPDRTTPHSRRQNI